MYSSNTNSIYKRVKKKNGKVDKRKVNDQLYELGHRIKRLKKQRRNSNNYELPIKRLRNKRRKLLNIAKFGLGHRRNIEQYDGSDKYGFYRLPDNSLVKNSKMINVKDNPTHYKMYCPGTGFKIVSDEKTPVAKWQCVDDRCRDIDCMVPKLGYYEVGGDFFLYLPDSTKYLDYQELPKDSDDLKKYYRTNYLKDLPEDKYYDGEKLNDLSEMYHFNPFTKELALYPYDKDGKKRCARGVWNGQHTEYKCTKYRCHNCYNCDTNTGVCGDNFATIARCAAGKILPIKPEGCNYESFDDSYVLPNEN